MNLTSKLGLCLAKILQPKSENFQKKIVKNRQKNTHHCSGSIVKAVIVDQVAAPPATFCNRVNVSNHGANNGQAQQNGVGKSRIGAFDQNAPTDFDRNAE